MSPTVRRLSVLLLLPVAVARAQQPVPEDRPQPLLSALSEAQRAQREAKRLFAWAAYLRRTDRLIEASRALEEAMRLDPEAASPRKSLAALYSVLGRGDDALTLYRQATDRDPGDYEAWQRIGEGLKERNRLTDAVAALARACESVRLPDDPRQHLLLLHELAVLAEKAGDWATAESAGRSAVAVMDKNRDEYLKVGFLTADEFAAEKALALENVGRAAVKRQRFDEALAAFAAAHKLYALLGPAADESRSKRIYWRLAEVQSARGALAEALEYLDTFLEARPAEVEPYRLRTEVLTRLGRAGEIVSGLERFARRDPKHLGLQALLAEQYAAGGRNREAEVLYKRVIDAAPRPEFYRGLFKLYESEQRLDEAVRMLEADLDASEEKKGRTEEMRRPAGERVQAMLTVLRTEPDMLRAMIPHALTEMIRNERSSTKRSAYSYYNLATLATRVGDLDAAERLFRESISRPQWGFQSVADDGLIGVLKARRKYAEIANLCEQRIANSPNKLNPSLYYYNLAEARMMLGQTDEALRAADQAIQLAGDQNRVPTRRRKVEIYLHAERFDEAVRECEDLLKEFRELKDVRTIRRTLASVYSAKKDHAKAEEQLRMLLALDPNDVGACNDLGYQLADQGRDLDEAERLVRRALELDRERKALDGPDGEDENPMYLDSLGWVLFRRGDSAGAKAALEKAVALPGGKDDPTVWDHLGDVYYRLGEPLRAKAAWDQSLKLWTEDGRRKSDDRREAIQRKRKLVGAADRP